MLEEMKARRAQKAYEEAFKGWQAQVDAVKQFIEVARTFRGGTTDGLILKEGERAFYEVSGTSLIEDRRGPGHYQGRSQGFSIPVASLGGHSVRYRVGASKGHYVQGAPVATAVDQGTVYITDQRVVFRGAKQTRECMFTKLIGYDHDAKAGETTFSVSNRQKPTTVHYGPDLSANFQFQLALALACFQGTTDELVASLHDQLHRLEVSRPAPPASPAQSSPPLPPPPRLPPPPVLPSAADGHTSGASELAIPDPPSVEDETAVSPFATQSAGSQPSEAATGIPGLPPPPTSAAVTSTSSSVPEPVTQPPATTPPGWYSDPWRLSPLRWWDGSSWTGYVSEQPDAR